MNGMTCFEAEELRLKACSGPVPVDEAAALSAHAATCERCQAFAADIDALEGDLFDFFDVLEPEARPGLEIAAGSSSGLVEAESARTTLRLLEAPVGPRARWARALAPLGALAAAALLAVVSWTFLDRSPAQAPSNEDATSTAMVVATPGMGSFQAAEEELVEVDWQAQERLRFAFQDVLGD
ncbi:MAG: hypothetical protein ACYS22_17220 [Planctomycetota bacterium]|jgi:anti-sigma factor RsiW